MGNPNCFDGGALSSAERERLALLLEELGEAQQVIGKILRHGYASSYLQDGMDNRALLEKELGDVLLAARLMANQGDIKPCHVIRHSRDKAKRVNAWLHYNTVPESMAPEYPSPWLYDYCKICGIRTFQTLDGEDGMYYCQVCGAPSSVHEA